MCFLRQSDQVEGSHLFIHFSFKARQAAQTYPKPGNPYSAGANHRLQLLSVTIAARLANVHR